MDSISFFVRTTKILLFLCFYTCINNAAVIQLDSSNFDSIIGNSDVAFVNFYADWCRFSQMLSPVFEETSNKFADNPRVVFGSVDCDKKADLAQKYHINKFPTLKFFRFGQLAKREYRGSRSVEAMAAFVQQHLEEVAKEFVSDADLESKIDKNRRNIIAHLPQPGVERDNLRRIAANLREDCAVWINSANTIQDPNANQVATLVYRPPRTNGEDQIFSASLTDADYVKQWITDKCIPLVREITFENAEELTEEGLPFLILFRHPDDHNILETYTQEVARQLADQKTAVNFLYADGKKFAHPLHHLGKSEGDLPILAIDSFRHMYLYPNMKELTTPGKLRQFILDLHSGKLHREFHHGADPTQPAAQAGHQAGDNNQPSGGVDEKTSPPESVFRKLKPSSNRYTIMKDEL